MNRFAALLDRLAYEPSRNAKLRLMTDYFRTTPDPGPRLCARRDHRRALVPPRQARHHPRADRGAHRRSAVRTVAGLCGRSLGDRRADVAGRPELGLPSPAERVRRGVGVGGDGELTCAALAEHPHPDPSPPRAARVGGTDRARGGRTRTNAPTLTHVVTTLAALGKSELPAQLAAWLDALDETGRWALLKLVTGALRIGVSARLAKTAVAALGAKEPDEIELLWPTLAPPYAELFAWIEGRAEKPVSARSGAIPAGDAEPRHRGTGLFPRSIPSHFAAEWKWDGIRVQAAAAEQDGRRVARLYSRTGEDISGAFPDLIEAMDFNGAIDGELLIMRDGRVQSFSVLQQRLNRKTINAKLIAEFPAHVRAYDLLAENGEDLRDKPFAERRARLEALVARLDAARIDVSPLVPFTTWDELAAARADPASAGAGDDAEAVEGVMLKRRDAAYLPGRPKGPWWKWKRDPHVIDAVLMYAQRGSGKRSSFYSDYTFGVWTAGRDRRRTGAGRQSLFRLHRRGAERHRQVRPQQHRQPLRAGARGDARGRQGPRDGGRVRRAAAIHAPQVGRRDALPAHQPAALGQAAARGRPAGNAGADAARRGRLVGAPARARFSGRRFVI